MATAAPLKLAIVYGHNGGTAVRPALRFAENDAARVAAALIEVAGVAPADLKLIQGKPKEDLEAALDWAKARVAAAQKGRGQAILFVYTSSHGDGGKGLELGPQTYAWADLKAKLAATKADVRVAFIDACHASGILEAGGKAAGAFDLKAEDRLTVNGEAFITSSAADEPSLEAGAYQGSVFTHHLLAGLRGAADRSGDGKISLDELYRYAYARAVDGDSGQTPGYAFKLAGHGELFVSTLKSAAIVTLPRGPDALTVAQADTGALFLELRKPEGKALALPPGRWELKIWRDGKAKVGRVTLGAGQRLAIDESGFLDAPAETAQLVRLSANPPHYCVTAIAAPPPLSKVADRLTKSLQGQEAHACFEGARATALTLTAEPAQKLRLKGTIGARPVDVLSDEPSIAADVARALAAGL